MRSAPRTRYVIVCRVGEQEQAGDTTTTNTSFDGMFNRHLRAASPTADHSNDDEAERDAARRESRERDAPLSTMKEMSDR